MCSLGIKPIEPQVSYMNTFFAEPEILYFKKEIVVISNGINAVCTHCCMNMSVCLNTGAG